MTSLNLESFADIMRIVRSHLNLSLSGQIKKKIQIKFDFMSGPMIFHRVMPIELKKKWKNLSFHYLTFEVIHIKSWYFL